MLRTLLQTPVAIYFYCYSLEIKNIIQLWAAAALRRRFYETPQVSAFK